VDRDAGGFLPNEQFKCAYLMAPDYPVMEKWPMFDCYLDNIFGAFLVDQFENCAAAIPLAMHIDSRPNDTENDESSPRDKLLAVSKFLAETKPSQRKVILVVNRHKIL
jgi:hypothetical protein